MKVTNFIKQLSVFLLILNFLAASVVFAQKHRDIYGPVAKAPKCSGAWTGTVTYSRYQTATNNKTVDRVSARGKDTTDFEMTYDYKANVVVTEAPEKNGSSQANASITSRLKSTEKVVAKEENSCDRGKTWKTMTGESLSTAMTVGEAKDTANVNVGMNTDGFYTVSVALPPIKGVSSGSQNTTYSGQCTTKPGKNFTMPNTPASIDGNSMTSDGRNYANPDDPNKISGSYTKTWQGVTETITWSLQRCSGPFRLTDLKFEHPKFPDFNNWVEFGSLGSTVDGNMVKIKAKVLNLSGETKTGTVKIAQTYTDKVLNPSTPDEKIGDGEMEVSVDPGEEKEVEMMWDTEGYAWYDDGRARTNIKIKADLVEKGKKVDSSTKAIKIAPKPLVLIHGVWEGPEAFSVYQNLLTATHSYDWKAIIVGEKAAVGVMHTGGDFLSGVAAKSMFHNAEIVNDTVMHAQKETNAWHVDMVGHSTGGLLARLYIQKHMPDVPDGRPQVKHLMMLGTPNNGIPCVDAYLGKLGLFKDQLGAAREFTNDEMAKFNQYVKAQRGARFSAMAGNVVPVICGGYEWNDGFIPVSSAIYGVPDFAYSNDLTNDMTDTRNFSNFVLGHVLTGPKGTYPRPVKSDPNNWERWKIDDHYSLNDNGSSGPAGFYSAAYSRMAPGMLAADSDPQTFKAELKIPAKQSVVIDVPVEAAPSFGVTFMAVPSVSVSLVNDKGVVVAKGLTGKPEASAMFRMLAWKKAVGKGTWKLKIENTSDMEQVFAGFGWSVSLPPANTPVAE